MAEKIKLITHVEDQPETIDWLPTALWNQLEVNESPWVQYGSPPKENISKDHIFESVFLLKKTADGDTIKVIYKIIPSHENESQQQKIVAQLKKSHVAIIDMMTTTPDGKINDTGTPLLQALTDPSNPVSILVWTAYPAAVPEEMRNSDRIKLCFKPPDCEEIVEHIIHTLLGGLSDAAN